MGPHSIQVQGYRDGGFLVVVVVLVVYLVLVSVDFQVVVGVTARVLAVPLYSVLCVLLPVVGNEPLARIVWKEVTIDICFS